MSMHPLRKKRLLIVIFIILGSSLSAYLIGTALKDNLNLFYEPSKIKNGEIPLNKRIRIGGMVMENSIERDPNSLIVNFVVSDFKASIPVIYDGILPDMFEENTGTVVTGRLKEDGVFIAEQVLAKHDENYMPPEVASALMEEI